MRSINCEYTIYNQLYFLLMTQLEQGGWLCKLAGIPISRCEKTPLF